MPVEALEFGEKGAIGEIAVEDADRIGWVYCGYKPVARRLDRFHVSRGNETCGPNQCEILHPAGSSEIRVGSINAPTSLASPLAVGGAADTRQSHGPKAAFRSDRHRAGPAGGRCSCRAFRGSSPSS